LLKNLTRRLGSTGTLQSIGEACFEDSNVSFLRYWSLWGSKAFIELLEFTSGCFPVSDGGLLFDFTDKNLEVKVVISFILEIDSFNSWKVLWIEAANQKDREVYCENIAPNRDMQTI